MRLTIKLEMSFTTINVWNVRNVKRLLVIAVIHAPIGLFLSYCGKLNLITVGKLPESYDLNGSFRTFYQEWPWEHNIFQGCIAEHAMKKFDLHVWDVICEYLILTMHIKSKVVHFTYPVSLALFAGKAIRTFLETAFSRMMSHHWRRRASIRSSIAVGDEFILKDCPGSAGQFISPYCKHHYDQSNGFFGETGNIPEDEKYTESSGSPG